MIINNKDDISKLFGEITFKNEGRKLVNDKNTYYSDYSDDDSSVDEELFDTGDLYKNIMFLTLLFIT